MTWIHCRGGHRGGAWWHPFLFLPQTVDRSQLQWATKMLNQTEQETNIAHVGSNQAAVQSSTPRGNYSPRKAIAECYYWIFLPTSSQRRTYWDPGPGWEKELGLRAQTLSRFQPVHSGPARAETSPRSEETGLFSIETLFQVTKKRNNKLIGHSSHSKRERRN